MNPDGWIISKKEQEKIVDKKKLELCLIKEFLQSAEFHIVECKPSERPDSVFTIRQLGQEKEKVVGIEHTNYYNDAVPGRTSPGQLLYDFWGNVTDIIESKIDEKSEFHNVHGLFKLNNQELKSRAQTITSRQEANDLLAAIADQLYDLIDKFLLSSDRERSYCNYRRKPENMQPFPDTYGELNRYFLQIDLQKIDLWQGLRYGWHANVHAANIGLSPEKLIKIVNQKKDECRDYTTDSIDELWLLITAPATTVHNATPNHPGVIAKLDNADLRDMCKSSGFNKVFFWSRMPPAWSRQIWPI